MPDKETVGFAMFCVACTALAAVVRFGTIAS